MRLLGKKSLSIVLCLIIMLGTVAIWGEEFTNPFVSKVFASEYNVGDTVFFGSYPQSWVKESELISELENIDAEWHSYEYYSGTRDWTDGQMKPSDYMRYCDVVYNGNKYRGIETSMYRPTETYNSGYNNTYQDTNGIKLNKKYWFRYDPIKWRILDPSSGLVMSEIVIDSQPFNNYGLSDGSKKDGYLVFWGDSNMSHYASDYTDSSIRSWLNNDFYETAFDDNQQSLIKTTELSNEGQYTTLGKGGYEYLDFENTYDRAFLLSEKDVLNPNYGFSSDYKEEDPARIATEFSAYALSQGLFASVDGTRVPCYWRLRSAGNLTFASCLVFEDGRVGCNTGLDAFHTGYGIRPAICIKDLKSDLVEKEITDQYRGVLYSQKHTIDEYGIKNAAYRGCFLNMSGIPLDGKNSSKDLCVPGLNDNMIPQGMAYYKNKNWVLIAAYDKNDNNCSVVFALDFATGKRVAQFDLWQSDSVPSKTHAGGIAVSDNFLYITNGKKVSYVSLNKLDASLKQPVKIKYDGNLEIGKSSFSCEGQIANIAYLDYSCGTLWAGNFYSYIGGLIFEKSWGYKASKKNNSLIVGYEVDGLSADEEISRIRNLVEDKKPTYTIEIPNAQINSIQGATFYNDTIILSTTPVASAPLGNSYYVFGDSITVISHKLVKGRNKLNWNAIYKASNLPGGQNIFFKDGMLYCVYESEALEESGEVPWKYTAHTDCVWEIDLEKMLERTPVQIIKCPVDVEVYNKSTGNLIAKIKEDYVEPIVDPEISIIAEAIDGEKIIYLPPTGDYEVKVTGNNTGVVNCTQKEFTYNGQLAETSRAVFCDLPVDTATTYSNEIENGKFLNNSLLMNGTETIMPSETFGETATLVSINVSSEGNGEIEGSGTYKIGDFVSLEAFLEDGVNLVGWYEGNMKVSDERIYSFVAKSNRDLVAKFDSNTSSEDQTVPNEESTKPDFSGFKIKNYSSTLSVDYKSTVIFHTTMDAPEGYEIVWSNNTKGSECKLNSVTDKEYKVSAKMVNKTTGEAEAVTEEVTVKVNTGFFAKLIAFFKGLFGSLPTYEDFKKK